MNVSSPPADNTDVKETRPPVIAIDGPTASGKGTLAKGIAVRLGFAYMDTGKLYRLVGWHLLEQAYDPGDEKAALSTAIRVRDRFDLKSLDLPDLRMNEVGKAASMVASMPSVRAVLVDLQKDFALHPPLFPDGKSANGAILDGRDIGTVICPDAGVKFFVTADPTVRAERRMKELQLLGNDVNYDAVLQDLIERDRRDSTRAAAPLVQAEDAVAIDTTHADENAMIDMALAHVFRVYPHLKR